jgi:hypothetical protein
MLRMLIDHIVLLTVTWLLVTDPNDQGDEGDGAASAASSAASTMDQPALRITGKSFMPRPLCRRMSCHPGLSQMLMLINNGAAVCCALA